MPAYVAMLRGINVGGRNRVKMADLEALFTGLGHSDVVTYVQSGNVVFRSPSGSAGPLQTAVEKRIARDLGLDVRVLIRSKTEMAKVLRANPFVAAGADLAKLHVTFLAAKPSVAAVKTVAGFRADPDEFRVAGREVFLHCPAGYGNTKVNNTFWERKLGVPATTRNWNTVTKLTELAGG